jgi:hypothetical protein
MNFGKFAKPIGLLAGSYPRVIGPGFASFPGLPFSYAGGFGFAKPVASAFIAPWGVW